MLTSGKENYLKTIYNENLKNNKITNKLIAELLDVSAPSVSEMISRLIEEDLICKNSEFGYTLTPKGKEATQILLKKHRLWEVFLINHLGYSWDEVHNDADILEHVTSNRLLERLNVFLGKPKFCPHGKAIYGNYEDDYMGFRLNELKVGFKGYINAIEDNKELLKYLTTKTIEPTQEFEIISIDEFDKSMVIKTLIKEIFISDKAASQIYVKQK